MDLVPPYWFDQRQGKIEPKDANTYRLTAPNLKEAFIVLQPGNGGRWSAALRAEPEGPDIAATAPEFETAEDACDAAFELYRVHVVI